MLKVFIDKPVVSIVISVIVVLLGWIGFRSIPVSEYPDIAPPIVTVSASYMGANADVVLNSVVVPLEEQINGMPGMLYMSSKVDNDGNANISVYFNLETDPDIALVNVQNRVAKAQALLPPEVIKAGVTTNKQQLNNMMLFSLISDDSRYDHTFLHNYVNINLIPELKRLNGIGDANLFSKQDFAMRIWLDPAKMSQHGLVPKDIEVLLSKKNIDGSAGRLGEGSKQSYEYILKYKGRFTEVEEFENIIVKSDAGKKMLRLKDVAKIELESFKNSVLSYTNNKSSVIVGINPAPGANGYNLLKECEAIISKVEKDLPSGLHFDIIYSGNNFLDAAFSKVNQTLLEALLLVFLVVFIFLQDLRSTLIPIIAVPVSIIGTFFFINLMGFSINLFTLYALILSIAIVVDDAIVVVEAVHANLEGRSISAKEATKNAMSKITVPIISITLVMSAVFVPVTFISGSTGMFYKQFGLTLAVAILISALNALTLSPALCALLLKGNHGHTEQKKNVLQRFFTAFNVAFSQMVAKYKSMLLYLFKHKWITCSLLAVFITLFVFLDQNIKKSFVPNEDTGIILADISLPPASSSARTTIILNQVDSLVRSLPEVQSVTQMSGQGMVKGLASSNASVIIKLKPWKEREHAEQHISAVTSKLMQMSASIPEARIMFFPTPALPGFATSSSVEFQLLNKTNQPIAVFDKVKNDFIQNLSKREEMMYATSFFEANMPQYEIEIDEAKCEDAGLSTSDIMSTLQGYIGGSYVSNMNKFGKMFKVILQSETKFRESKHALQSIYVKTKSGEMAPISQFATLKESIGAESISRYNLYTSIQVMAAPANAFSTGDAINTVSEVAKTHLPSGYDVEFSGLTREETQNTNQALQIFLLCLVFVYFLLCAQFNNFLLPLAVLLSLPFGLAGAYLFTWMFGLDNNIYLQISIIMLIGLLAKNAILIIEFSVQQRNKGISLAMSAMQGATSRLRPILMTSFAFVIGILPLMFSKGVGAAGNQAVATGAVGGMLVGTVFGVMVVPILYLVFQFLSERVIKKSRV